jgi:hypothetical protein
MPDTASALRAEIKRNAPHPRSQGFPLELRSRIGLWALERQAHGTSWGRLASQLGISRSSARTWALHAEGQSTSEAKFLPVILRTEPLAVEPLESCVVHTPRGYRVSGLNIESLIALLRGLE